MKIRIKKIAPLQAGKMLATIYGLFSIVFVPFILLASILGLKGNGGMPVVMVVVLPLIYIAAGFIGGVIGSFIYNLVAGRIGGMEMEFEEEKA